MGKEELSGNLSIEMGRKALKKEGRFRS